MLPWLNWKLSSIYVFLIHHKNAVSDKDAGFGTEDFWILIQTVLVHPSPGSKSLWQFCFLFCFCFANASPFLIAEMPFSWANVSLKSHFIHLWLLHGSHHLPRTWLLTWGFIFLVSDVCREHHSIDYSYVIWGTVVLYSQPWEQWCTNPTLHLLAAGMKHMV